MFLSRSAPTETDRECVGEGFAADGCTKEGCVEPRHQGGCAGGGGNTMTNTAACDDCRLTSLPIADDEIVIHTEWFLVCFGIPIAMAPVALAEKDEVHMHS